MATKLFLRTSFNYDSDAVSRETGITCDDLTLTKQSFADECDINTIVKNFGLTGQLPDSFKSPQYGDFEGIFDYQTALNSVIQAQESFNQLPADVRYRFHNDPQHLLTFVSNPDNYDEALRLGLAVERPVVSTTVVEIPSDVIQSKDS